SFHELLGRVRATALAAYEHQDLPFEKLVEELAPERSLAHTPLFQAMLSSQELPRGAFAIGPLAVSPLDNEPPIAKFDLSLALDEREGTLGGALRYATDLFDGATAARLMDHLERLLAAAAAAPERRVTELEMLAAAQRAQLVCEWNDTAQAAPALPVHRLFALQAERAHPAALAVRTDAGGLTYRDLAARVQAWAGRLRALGAGPERLVAVCLERSADLVTALLAVLTSGAAYLPLEPRDPAPRRAQVLEDARPLLLLTRRALAAAGTGAGVATLCVEDLPAAADPAAAAPAAAAPAAPAADGPAGALAYVIYTSGSTGRPKGVAVDNRSLSGFLAWIGGVLDGAGVRWLPLLASVTFDASLKQLFVPLLRGEAVRVVDEDTLLRPARLLEILDEAPGAGCNAVPAMWEGLLGALERGEAARPANLCALFLGGERLPDELAARTRRLLPGLAIHNLYGPTEATSNAIWARLGETGRVVLGRPVGGARIVLADPGLRLTPLGAVGEICIGGRGVGRGYLGRPEQTAARFVPDPYGGEPGGRLYRTGDLARRLPDGSVDYLGRLDHQVKVRGFRVELGEIEAVLAEHPGVREAAVLLHAGNRGEGGEGRLIGHVAPRSGERSPAAAELRSYLAGKLPAAMVPAAFQLHAELPRTPAGKLDRSALAAMGGQPDERPDGPLPETPLERALAEMFAKVLRRDPGGRRDRQGAMGQVGQIGLHDDFFELGGHSMRAVELVAGLRDAFGVDLPLRHVFDAPTVAGLAGVLLADPEWSRAVAASALATHPETAAVPIARAASRREPPLSHGQQRLWFLARLEPGAATYNVPLVLELLGPLAAAALAASLHAIERRHETLRTTFPTRAGRPWQRVAAPAAAALPAIDLGALPPARREREAAGLAAAEWRRPFDLEAGPLWRARLLRLDGGTHRLVVTLHHIICDGWSIEVLLRELGAGYAAFAAGGAGPSLPELPIQYGDYALWQQRHGGREALAGPLAAWERRLAGHLAPLGLAVDRAPKAPRGAAGAVAALDLPADLLPAVREQGRRQGATLFMALLAVYEVLLARYTGRGELLVGTPVANRTRTELKDLIGFFANTLALPADVAAQVSFRELLAGVREVVIAALRHQDLPLQMLVEDLAPEREESRVPLLEAVFMVHEAPAALPAVP
ncbi:MAG: amino acid adenylation domain-containing protein, partial [Acidobacteria bacterium]|nr:amino acid adenylation domain-containing protein [Acidobacteriota bacterium]